MGKKKKIFPKRIPEAIVMGASWGGMDAIIELLKDLPALYPIPIIIVVHRLRNTQSSLSSILAKYIPVPVKEVDEKENVLPNYIYLAPANYHVLIERDKTLSLDVSEEILYARPSIDVLFESAAQVFEDRLLGILLTGANADGSNGLKAISERGGTTIIQNPEEATVSTMPLSALGKTRIDYIFTLKEMRNYLLELV